MLKFGVQVHFSWSMCCRNETIAYIYIMKQTNTPKTANMIQVTFQAPKRVTRKAMQSAIENFGNTWYCMTVNGNPAFFFPETDTAFIPGNAYYSDFHMHLRCAGMNQQVQETPQNWH